MGGDCRCNWSRLACVVPLLLASEPVLLSSSYPSYKMPTSGAHLVASQVATGVNHSLSTRPARLHSFIFSSKLLLRSSPIRLSSWVDPHETVLNRNNSNNNTTIMCVTICYYSAPAVPFVLWCSTRTGAVLCVSQCA